MTPELVIILFSLLVFISILLYNPARTYGIPAMLIFIGVGVGLGNGGFDGFTYDYPQFTDTISSLALNLIIFSGGLHTSIQRIKPVLVEGLILSTVGVLLTAVILGYFIFQVTGLSLLAAILMGAIVSSTDAAAVFSILESKQLRLKENTDATLELESGTNDPMAIVLVLGLTLLILNPATETSYLILFFFKQLGLGSLVGIAFGLVAARLLTTVRISEKGLEPVLGQQMPFLDDNRRNVFGHRPSNVTGLVKIVFTKTIIDTGNGAGLACRGGVDFVVIQIFLGKYESQDQCVKGTHALDRGPAD